MAYLISPTDEVVVWRDLFGVSLTMEREHTVYLLFTQRNVLGAEGFAWREKESTCIQFPPPLLNCEKKKSSLFSPPSCLSWYILHSCLSQKWSIYSATMLCLWMLNVQCKDLYFFFCLEAFVVNLLSLPQCYTRQNWKRKRPTKLYLTSVLFCISPAKSRYLINYVRFNSHSSSRPNWVHNWKLSVPAVMWLFPVPEPQTPCIEYLICMSMIWTARLY